MSALPADKRTCRGASKTKLLKAASRNSKILKWMYLKPEYVCCPNLQPHNYKSADSQPAYERSLLCMATITLIHVVMETRCKPGQETGTHNAFK